MKLAVLSDIHEDYESLKCAITKIERSNCDKIVCLGDISGFSVPYYHHQKTRNAHECLNLVRSVCDVVIIGNHDLNAAKRLPEISPEFEYPLNWFELDYHKKQESSGDLVWLYDNDELNPLYKFDDIEYLKTLSEYEILELDGQNILLSHYIYPNLTGSSRTFIRDKIDFNDHFEFMNEKGCPISISGHAHIPESLIATNNEIRIKKFKKIELKSVPVCIGAPSVVHSNSSGRFLIFDTKYMVLENIKI